MTARFDNRVVVVTGAANGIGLAACRLFAKDGASVVIGVDRDRSGLESLVEELGGSFRPFIADVSDADPDHDYIADTRARYGRIDIAFLNAGILGPTMPLHEYRIEDFDRVMAVNARGVWLGLARCMAAMRDGSGGVITITSSTGGLRGSGGMGAYAASKHAVVGMMKSAAIEGGPHGIRVNAVHPGPTDTAVWASAESDKTTETGEGRSGLPQLYRVAAPEEVAAVVAFLSSDEAGFCTGGPYPVDGGLLAGPPYDG